MLIKPKKRHALIVLPVLLLMAGLISAPKAVAQDESLLAAISPTDDADIIGAGRNLRSAPKRLTDYNIPGLENTVNLDSVEPFPVVKLIEFLAYRAGLKNIVMANGLEGMATILRFDDVAVGDALEVVFSVNKLAYEIQGGIIQIMTDEEYRQKYGVSFYEYKQARIVELEYADATRVSSMLANIKSEIGTVVADPLTGTLILIDTTEKIMEMLAVIKKADINTIERQLPTDTRVYRLQYADIETVSGQVGELLTAEVGRMQADRRTRTLIVTDLPHKLAMIDKMITNFDERPKQVFIEAKIVEVTLSEEYQFGINWDTVFDGIDPRFQVSGMVRRPILGPESPGIGAFSYKTIIGDSAQLNLMLEALEAIGETKVLQNPHVAVLDGEEATIRVVQDLPYAETAAEITGSDTNFVGEDIIFIEVGVSLTVTPHITDEGFIRMHLRPEISTGTYEYQAFRQIPVVSKTFTDTSVNIKNGETIIIAGMIENGKRNLNQGVPFLARMPLLGHLFKSTTDELSTREVAVFMTPRIITGEKPVLRLRDMNKRPKPLRATSGTNASAGKKFKPIR